MQEAIYQRSINGNGNGKLHLLHEIISLYHNQDQYSDIASEKYTRSVLGMEGDATNQFRSSAEENYLCFISVKFQVLAARPVRLL